MSVVEGESIYGFYHNRRQRFLKITVSMPRLVASVRRALEQGAYQCEGVHTGNHQCFEANIDFEIRCVALVTSTSTMCSFMVDTSITGCCWIEVPKNAYEIVHMRESRCQLEVTCHYSDLVAHAPVGDWSDLAPFRILSFDIECAGTPFATKIA